MYVWNSSWKKEEGFYKMSRKMLVIRPGPDKVVVIGFCDPKSGELPPRVGLNSNGGHLGK